jgi:hypothetical protein
MAEDRPVDRRPIWLLRLFYPLPGAITGAAAGFHLYLLRPGLNMDTLAPAIIASAWAVCGMLIGGLLTSLTAWLAERRFHRWFSTSPMMTGSLALLFLTGLSLWIHAPLEARLRTLLWPPHQTEQSRPPAPSEPTCAQEPPSDQPNWILWQQECR